MALQKEVTLASGVTADYHRIDAFRWNPNTRELQAAVGLYLSSSEALAEAPPVVAEFARFRVSGSVFDAHLARTTLSSQATTFGFDIVALVYELIKEVCEAYNDGDSSSGGGVVDPEAYIVCDFGHGFYHDATDV
jgi:hypothetical protein